MKNRVKKVCTVLIAAGISLSSVLISFAGSWQQDNMGWWYQYDDGTYPKKSVVS